MLYKVLLSYDYKWDQAILKQTANEMIFNGKLIANFSNCNYLGLSTDPRVVQEAKNSIDEIGYGIGSAPLMSGTLTCHKQLEKTISQFFGTEDTMLFSSGYVANLGFFQTFLFHYDAIISDQSNHASLIDGIRLARAKRFIFKHNDIQDLERKLIEASKYRFKVVVTEGIFSMDGDICPLPQLMEVCKKYNALIYLDEAHSAGVIGKTGRGSFEHFGIEAKEIDFISGTFSKTFGGTTGGYITGKAKVIEILRHVSRPYVFSHGVVPVISRTQIKVFEIMQDSDKQRQQLLKNTLTLRQGLKAIGYNVLGDDCVPMVPVMICKQKECIEICKKLLIEGGIYTVALPYPVVPKGMERIRLIATASHTEEQIQHCIDCFDKFGKELGLLGEKVQNS